MMRVCSLKQETSALVNGNKEREVLFAWRLDYCLKFGIDFLQLSVSSLLHFFSAHIATHISTTCRLLGI